MKIIIQRALRGSVTVEGEIVGSIGKGVVVLVGIAPHDGIEAQNYMVNKVRDLLISKSEADISPGSQH